MPKSHQEMFFPVGCGCPVKQSVLMSSSASFTWVQVGTVDFASRHLVLQHSDKRRVIADLKVYFSHVYLLAWINVHWSGSHVIRAVLTHATIEEIEAEKSLIEGQAVGTE
jgi:ribosome recycling factor